MKNRINGKTQVVGIIGHPVGHSLSPRMQNAAFRACDLDYVYVPFDVHPDHLGESVAGLRALGVRGFNVTIPHKAEVMRYLDALDESAVQAGAVNTVLNAAGQLTGFNTDGDGLVKVLAEELDFLPMSRKIVVVGAGGAARGAIASLCRSAATQITIINRSLARAQVLAEDMRNFHHLVELNVVDVNSPSDEYLSDCDLLINTTSVGMNGDSIDCIDLDTLPGHARVYDMVYAPLVTPLLEMAKKRGLKCANGLGMLAGQGELAFRIWSGVVPPVGMMRSVLDKICSS